MSRVYRRFLLRLLFLPLLVLRLMTPAPCIGQSFKPHPLDRRKRVRVGKTRPGFVQDVEAQNVRDDR
ncbi:MAG TPA: hypothetical protein VFY40_06495 [Blastocatellia bacterium]|nr:hypothetical protein [Blastocatellia bacterium]